MNNITNAVINQLPIIGYSVPYFVTLQNYSTTPPGAFSQNTITNAEIVYGNVTLIAIGLFIALDNSPIAIKITSTDTDDNIYYNILYTKAIYPQSIPNNFVSIIQKIPFGIFSDTSLNSLVGQIFKAKSQCIDDYYKQYLYVQGQVYSDNYSADLEYEYNQTVGLLSNNYDTIGLFHLFSTLPTVALNSYDLELFISQYIWYRLGISCPVYINDHVDPIGAYWYLGKPGFSELGITTILAPDDYTPAVQDLQWVIYNSSSFTVAFQQEITNLITRISRADIGNPVIFNPIVNPVDDGFTYWQYTYPNDPRLIYNKCLAYTGDQNFPLNILGYTKNY